MTLEEAKKIVEDTRGIFSELDDKSVCLDDWFSADQLEAIAIVMRAERLAHNTQDGQETSA